MSGPNAFDLLRVALESAGIRYAVGGSWASTAFGEPRSTNDVDVLADVTQNNLPALLSHLPDSFYADLQDAVSALSRGRPFNLIHMSSALKFDIFPAGAFPIGREELDRALLLEDTGLSREATWFVTPEDILLAKLHWYKLGGEVSDVQWRDIMGLVRSRADTLDHEYLDRASSQLEVHDLLHRSIVEAALLA